MDREADDSRNSTSSVLRAGAVALVAVAAALLVRYLVDPWLLDSRPFVTFVPAVAIAAWYGGIWTGVLAALLGFVAADWLFIDPRFNLNVLSSAGPVLSEVVVFGGISAVIIGVTETLHRAREAAHREMQKAARERKTVEVTLASIGDGVISTDANGRVTFMNPIAEALTGWKSSEAIGRPLEQVFRIISEHTRDPAENPCAKVLRTGSIVGLANRTLLVAKDGTELPIDDSAAPITDETGMIHGVVLVFRDTTSQRKTFDAVQKLAAIVEHSDDAVISKTSDGIITSWNAAAERMFGHTAEEAIGKHIWLIVPPEHQYEHWKVIEQLKRGERIDHWDTVRVRRDGSRVEVSLQISPIKNSYGEVIGASKVAREMTERKRQEAALEFLAETSAFLAALSDQENALQQAAAAMVPFAADWCVIHVVGPEGSLQARACAHWDDAREHALRDMLTRYPVNWNTPGAAVQALRSGRTEIISDMPDALLERIALNEEHLAALRGLSPNSVVSIPLRVRNRTIGVMSFVRSEPGRGYTPSDVKLLEDVARRVSTAIDNAELFGSVRMADQQKDEFLAMLAHELRNPLAAIRYATDVARLPNVDPKQELLDMIDRQVKQLGHLIDDLLDISRISRGKIQLRKELVDVVQVARRAADTMRPLIEEKQHELLLEVSDEPVFVSADVTRLEQILGNLLTNAAKYTPEGGRLTVRVAVQGDDVVMSVADTGIGIAPEVLPHVFELFAQADKTLDRSQGGLGIGLTVVRNLAEMHGWSVTAKSEGIGLGAEFTVRIPVEPVDAQPEPEVNEERQERQEQLRVLIVEDNRDSAMAQSLLLRAEGHDISIAYDGLSALRIASEFRPHVMLVDIGLPGLNGYEVAERIRESELRSIVLVAVSGYGQLEDQRRSRDAGFNHHLVKPVDGESLLTLLGSLKPVQH